MRGGLQGSRCFVYCNQLFEVNHEFNPFRLSFSELKCARGGHIIFLESIFQHTPHEIVIYSINRKSYNKKVNILWKLNKCATDSSVIYE